MFHALLKESKYDLYSRKFPEKSGTQKQKRRTDMQTKTKTKTEMKREANKQQGKQKKPLKKVLLILKINLIRELLHTLENLKFFIKLRTNIRIIIRNIYLIT